jgi:hypothetical protein
MKKKSIFYLICLTITLRIITFEEYVTKNSIRIFTKEDDIFSPDIILFQTSIFNNLNTTNENINIIVRICICYICML